MTDIIIHIGLHKTGTTTLQRQLYPAYKNLNFIKGPELDSIIRSITKTDPIYFNALVWRDLISRYVQHDCPNLISCESLSGSLNVGIANRELDHRSPILSNLSMALPDARIIIVLRRQDSLARSLYRQYLKTGGTEPIECFYGMNGDMNPALSINTFRFSPYIKMIEERFPKGFLVLLFEEFVHDQSSFLQKLSDFIGVDVPDITLKNMNRTSLGPFGLEVARLSNYIFHSRLNPGGIIPGIPLLKHGHVKWQSPMSFIHSHWPWTGRLGPNDALMRIGNEILDKVKDDNIALDKCYMLGLNQYGYY